MKTKFEFFAGSGSCSAPDLIIRGKVLPDKITFISREFSGTMDSQIFWDRLAAFAKEKGAYIKLVY